MNEWRLRLWVLCVLLLLTGCHGHGDEAESSSPPEPVDSPQSKKLPIEQKEKVVTLGLEGHQQQVVMELYTSSWIQLEYDSRLEITAEAEGLLELGHPAHPVRFRIIRLEDEDQIEQERAAAEAEGYELYHRFALDDGRAYIYYLYEKRHQLELYHVVQNDQSVLVSFQFSEEIADLYQFVFDYMFNTLSIQ